jgi:threonine aldolase
MGNLAAALAHCGRGDELIVGDKAHIFLHEAGGVSALGGIHSLQLPNQPDGSLLLEDIRSAIREDDSHHPITRLICLENTQNACGGVLLSAEYTQQVGALARQHGLRLHLDGARLFNAATALGVSAAELAAPCDSVMFCLSKGLCAPVGSMLCGTADFIARAHRARKQLGGGMRQAGVLAAAGIVALTEMTTRLAEDHRRARTLAQGLAAIPGVTLDFGLPQTNMVYISLSKEIPLNAPQTAKKLAGDQILVDVVDWRRFRLVTHYWIDDAAIERAVEAFAEVL